MFHSKLLFAVPVMTVLMAGTAHAALTADQVWAGWQALGAKDSMTISAATQVKDAGVLRLNGVTVSAPDGRTTLTISDMTMTEEADGSVSIRPGEVKMNPASDGTVSISNDGLVVTVHDDAGGFGYGIDAPVIAMAYDVKQPASAGSPAGAGAGTQSGSVNITGLTGRFTREAEAGTVVARAARVAYDFTGTGPQDGMRRHQSSDAVDYEVTGKLTIPAGVDLARIDTALAFVDAARKGLGLSADLKVGVSNGSVEQIAPPFPIAFSGVTQPGTMHIELNRDLLSMQAASGGAAYVFKPPMVPAEVKADAAGMGADITLPIGGAEAAPFRYMIKLQNLVLEEAGWALFDPQGKLSHAPVDLALDLGGMVKLNLLDLMEASEKKQQPKEMPEIQSANINELSLSLAGAVLKGTGAFNFDNSAVATGGAPMPIGTAELHLSGANRLMDGLVALGVLKDTDVQGARMMLAMFSKAEGEDAISSTIEAKEGGQILVNGQRVK